MSSHDTPISPLRQRMIEDMTLRKLSPKTQSGYIRWVKRLNGFLKRSPATATAEDLPRFQLDLVERCQYSRIAYNSCRNRHCPKCQGAVAKAWLAAREADLLPVEYYHVLFTLPAPIGAIAYHNKAVIYGLLFRAAAETLLTIAADPKHLGARIGLTMVLHTWGSALTHHPHVHCIVPGGGISLDAERWVARRRGFFLPVRVLSRLFRRLLLEKLAAAHRAGELQFFGEHQSLEKAEAFATFLKPLRPFAGSQAVLAYLSRYTRRVAIANSRLIALDEEQVTFKFKDYRAKGRCRYKTMRLPVKEFMRRFLQHVLPPGFHRIRHYGLLANAVRVQNLARARELLAAPISPLIAVPILVGGDGPQEEAAANNRTCPCCGAPMIIIETFERGHAPRAPPWPRAQAA